MASRGARGAAGAWGVRRRALPPHTAMGGAAGAWDASLL